MKTRSITALAPGFSLRPKARILLCLLVGVLLSVTKASGAPESQVERLCRLADQHNTRVSTRYQAMQEINEALKLAPNNPACWHIKAQILHNTEEDEEALPAIEHALRLNPKSWTSWHLKGEIFLYLQKLPEALACIELAEKLSPNILNRMQKTEILSKMKKFDLADKEASAIIKEQPTNYNAYNLRAAIAAHRGDWNKVVADTTSAMKYGYKTGISHFDHLRIRADAYIKLKKYDLAIADALEVSKSYPDDRQTHVMLAKCYHATGKFAKEKAELKIIDGIDNDLVR
jgi:tetratricopeptide (TPR) repeat protein